jgi:hypothetical protein
MRPRVLFAGNFHWNAGSSHVIAEYQRATDTVDCEIGVSTQLARMDSRVPQHLPLVDDLGWATHLVLVFEGRQFLTDRQLEMCEQVPRRRRIIIDPDGHWRPPARLGDDTSAGAYTHKSWHDLYVRLADLVLQPRLEVGRTARTATFPYFGMPPIHRLATDSPDPVHLPFQLQYIGSNWWRWQGITEVVDAAHDACPPLRRIRVCGRWWNGETCPGHESASRSEPGWLQQRGVEVVQSVPFGQVVATMSTAAFTPILARPLLAQLGLLTPRMFETLASGSTPLIANDLAYTTRIYGEEARAFILGDTPGETISRIVREWWRYRRIVAIIQRRTYAAFHYERVLTDLIQILNDAG